MKKKVETEYMFMRVYLYLRVSLFIFSWVLKILWENFSNVITSNSLSYAIRTSIKQSLMCR